MTTTQFQGWGKEEIDTLRKVIEQGVQVFQAIHDDKQSLNDNIESVSKQLEIPKKEINAAIKMAFNASMGKNGDLQDHKNRLQLIEDILDAIGRHNSSNNP